jgi:hypothetical protein
MSHFVSFNTGGPGQILNIKILPYNDIGQAASTAISSASYQTIASYSYTPSSNNSYLIVEYYSTYSVNGTNGDSFGSHMSVNGSEISLGYQLWTNSSGGGDRSGVLFPLMGRYTNSSLSSKTILIEAKRIA